MDACIDIAQWLGVSASKQQTSKCKPHLSSSWLRTLQLESWVLGVVCGALQHLLMLGCFVVEYPGLLYIYVLQDMNHDHFVCAGYCDTFLGPKTIYKLQDWLRVLQTCLSALL